MLSKGKNTRRFQIALGSMMMLGWLLITFIWGHCHLNPPQEGKGNVWQKRGADMWQGKGRSSV